MSDDYDLPRDDLGSETSARLRCPACGATFPRREAATPKKGQLACPDCGSTGLEDA